MKRLFLSLVALLFTSLLFAQNTIVLKKQSYEVEGSPIRYYYQGLVNVSDYTPTLNATVQAKFTNCKVSSYVRELRTNMVDVSVSANYWKELNPLYALACEDMISDSTYATLNARMEVVQTTATPGMGSYAMVIQAWDAMEDVDEITLTMDDCSISSPLISMYVPTYPQANYNLLPGQQVGLDSLIKYSMFEKVESTPNEYTSSNDEVATVDESGVITAIAAGTATISAKVTGKLLESFTSGETEYTAGETYYITIPISITVRQEPTISIPWNQYGLDTEGLGKYVGVDSTMSDFWQFSESTKISAALEAYSSGLSSSWEPTLGDIFYVYVKGVANESGSMEMGLVDEREAVSYWCEMSTYFAKDMSIKAGEIFEFSFPLIVGKVQTEGVALSVPNIIIPFQPNYGSSIGITKVIELTLDNFDVTYIPVEDLDGLLSIQEGVSGYLDIEESSTMNLTLNAPIPFQGKGTWSSSNEEVATVEAGVVTGVASGMATITYTEVFEENEYSVSYVLDVITSGESPIPSVSRTEFEYCVGEAASALVAESLEGATLKWYQGETALESAPIPSTTEVGTQTYFVSQVLGTRAESQKVEITVEVKANTPKPTISGETEIAICEGTTVTFTVTGDDSYSWINADKEIVRSGKELQYSNLAAGEYTYGVYTVTDGSSCASDTTWVSVTVNGKPSVVISGTTVVEQEEEFTLTANATSAESLISSYLWSIGSTAQDETGSTFTTSLASSSAISVVVTDENSCTASAKVTMKVGAAGDKPYAAFDNSSYTVELGETLEIIPLYTQIDDFSNLSFVMLLYNGTSTFVTNSESASCLVSGAKKGVDSLIMNLTYSDGVETYRFIDTCEIVVVPSSKVAVPTVKKTLYEYCQLAEATDIAADITVTEGATLKWYEKTNGVYGEYYGPTAPNTSYAHTQELAVSQLVEGLEGEMVEIRVDILEKPVVSCTVPEAATEGESVAITAEVSNLENVVACSYEWFMGETSFSTDASTEVTLDKVGDQTIRLVTTAQNGCSDMQERIIAVAEAVEKPTVAVTAYEYCEGAVADELSAIASENAILNWYIGDTRLEAAPIPSTEVAGTYKYGVSQTIEEKESAKIEIEVVVNPAPSLEVSPLNAVVYQNESTEFNVFSIDECLYEWSVGETTIGKGNSVAKTFYAVGDFKISVFALSEKGCSSTATTTLSVKKKPSVSFEKEQISIYEGETFELQPLLANFEPTETPEWKVADDAIVTVADGVVTGVAVGKTTVTYSVKYVDEATQVEDTYSASCEVTVKEDKDEIVCQYVEYEMIVGEHVVVDAVVHSKIASSSYSVESSNIELAEITDKMLVALAEGDLEVYVISDEDKELRDTMLLHINPFIPAKDVSMPKQITIKVGSDTTLTASVVPSNASYTDVVFLEKDDEYISVMPDGRVIGKSVGTSIVTASTREGLQAQTLVYVTSSSDEIVKIQVPDTVYLKEGETMTIPCKVSPTTIKSNDMNWTILDGDVADVTHSGVLTGKKSGATILTVSYGSKIGYVIVYVTQSVAPTISLIPSITLQQPGSEVKVCLKNYISDDITPYENLQLSISENENVLATIEGDTVIFSLKNADFIGSTKMKISATEVEKISSEDVKLTTSRMIDIAVIEKPNEAPQIVMNTITVPFKKYTQIVIADMAIDDYTPSSELSFRYEEGENLMVKNIKNTSLRIYPLEDEWSGEDVLTVWFTDAEGLESTAEITVVVQASENQPPVIAEIPQQYENDTVTFPYIDLALYVTDDYTSPSSIYWTATTSENVSVKILGSQAEISSLNEYWRGAEVITFTAMDQGGLTSSYDVTFYRETETTEEEADFGWYGKPQVSIISSRYYGTPGETITLIGTYYGSNCTGMWEVEGLELEKPYDLIQYLTFDTTGYYDVTFYVMYTEKDTLSKSAEIAMYGNIDRNPAICIGDSKELVATTNVDSYEWSTGETTKSIVVNPLETTTYYLTMKKGLVTLIDTIDLRVSVPVSLPKDSVMCAESTYELVAQGEEYVSYEWNTGESTSSIVIPAEVKEYVVNTVDDLGCESSDTFNVTKINELPLLNLGADTSVCDKQTLTLDGGEGFVYDWNITKYNQEVVTSDEQTVVLDSSAVAALKIVDNNMCESFDTINVTFTYPYPEEIGVVTYSESSKNIIVAWERTANVNTKNYRVERQITNVDWEQVGEPVLFDEFGIVVDEATNYEKRAYKYRLITTDGCDNEAVSGVYRSSYMQPPTKEGDKLSFNWWTYQSPREGNVKGCYLWRIPAEGGSQYETVETFDTADDFIGWTDDEGVFKEGDFVRVAFELDETVYENAVNDADGNLIEYQERKAESGPFSIAISNIAEVENEDVDGIESVSFPADVAVYPTVVSDVLHVALASQTYGNYTIEVISSDGQIMMTTQTGDVSKAIVDVPTANFSQGLYSVKISIGDATKTIKFVK